jgi:hypothetical protein
MISRANLLAIFSFVVATSASAAWAADADGGPVGSPAGIQRILGIVENGNFVGLAPAVVGLRLTTIQRQEARSVVSGELGLGTHEGEAIMVEGVRDNDWLYEARIVERAGPILTAVVREVFRSGRPK